MLPQREYSMSLIQTIRSSLGAELGAGALLSEANSAYDELKANPRLRNILMSLPPLNEPPALLESIISFYFSNESHDIIPIKDLSDIRSSSKISFRKRKINRKIQTILRSLFTEDPAIATYYQNSFPICHQYHLFGKLTFLYAILGNDFDDLGRSTLSMFTIFSRLKKTETAMASNIEVNFQNGSELGNLWCRTTDADRLPALKKISSEFPVYLNCIAKEQYLDVILKIQVPGVVIPENRKKPDDESNPVTGVDVLSPDNVLLGTVLVWDEFLSPEFKEGYYQKSGFKSLEWLREPNMHRKGTERLFRFESKGTDFDHPFYLIYGEQMSSRLYKSAPLSPVGMFQVDMANYVEKLYHAFLYSRLVEDFGRNTAKDWIPCQELTDSVVHSLNGQFSWHSDAKEMLVNEHDPRNNSKTMSVTTFTMNNCPQKGAASLCYRQKEGEKNVASIPLGPTALHFQLIGTQAGLQHSITIDPKKKNVGSNMRWTSSCRSTGHLQDIGMEQFLQRNVKTDIPTYGNRQHYSFFEYWRKPDDMSCNPFLGVPTYQMSGQSGESHLIQNAIPDRYVRKVPTTLSIRRSMSPLENRCTNGILPYSFCPCKWKLRSDGSKKWPKLHAHRIIQMSESLAEFLTSGRSVKYLNEYKLTVTVHIPTLCGDLLAVPHPPLWNHDKKLPVMPGTFFPLLYVCRKHGLAYNTRGSSTWRTDHRCLVLVILYHDYKSALPFSKKLVDDLNEMTGDQKLEFSVNVTNVHSYMDLTCPRIELFLIQNKEPGRGFRTMGGGGNPVSTGTYCSTGATATSGADFISGSNQSLNTNKRNLAANTKFESKGRVSIFLCGDFLPASQLLPNDSKVMMCCYLSTYICDERLVKQDTRDCLKEEIALYESIFPCTLSQPNMQYRLKEHYLFGFKYDSGINYWCTKEDWAAWTHLHVRSDDKRRLCIDVPAGFSTKKIFSITDKEPLFDEDKLYERFYKEGHYKHLTSLCIYDNDEVPTLRRSTLKSEFDNLDISPIIESSFHEYSYRHVEPNISREPFDESLHGSELFRLQEARTCSLDQFLVHMKTLSVAGACRILSLNVDDDGLLGPLLDPMEEDSFVLSNFLEHFGDQSASDQDSLYMKHLSGIHQLVAMPSMIRAHDPKVAFLIECAGHQRHLRPGIGFIRSNKSITSNFLFQSIIVKSIGKVSHLIELSKWLNLCEGGTSTKMRLPTVEDSQVLIDFFHQSMISEGGYLKKRNDWLHGQYQQDVSLHTPADYENFIGCVSTHTRAFIDILCQKGTDDQLTRVECIDTLCSIFMDKCGCRDLVTTRFQCSQVLANMEELIANSPFGDVKGIGLGHGSLVGKSILVLKSENVDDCLDEILLFIQALPDYDLKVLSLHRFTDGVVRLLANNRVLNRVDAEHMLCKLYIIYERLKGGSRSASVSPRLFF
jgi:hypothetical protein